MLQPQPLIWFSDKQWIPWHLPCPTYLPGPQTPERGLDIAHGCVSITLGVVWSWVGASRCKYHSQNTATKLSRRLGGKGRWFLFYFTLFVSTYLDTHRHTHEKLDVPGLPQSATSEAKILPAPALKSLPGAGRFYQRNLLLLFVVIPVWQKKDRKSVSKLYSSFPAWIPLWPLELRDEVLQEKNGKDEPFYLLIHESM